MPKFQLNNSFYNIPDDIVNQFKQDNPDATLVEEPGKTTPTTPGAVVEETAAPDMDSKSVGTSLELQKDKPNILQSLAARTARGFASTFKGLQAVPENIIFALGSSGMNTEEKKAFRAALSTGIPGTSVVTTGQYDNLINDINNYVRKTENESVTEAISKGNIAEAAELTVGGALESAPSVLAAMTGYGGIALFGSSVAGNKFDEEFKENPERFTALLAANAIGSGAIEATFELATRGLLKQFGIVQAKSGKEAAKKLLEKGVSSFLKKTGVAYTKEAGSEAATELTQILFDKATLDKDVDLGEAFTRVADAGIIGGFMGGTISTVAQIGDTNTGARNRAEYILTPEVQKQKMKASAAKISNLTVDLEAAEGEAAEIIKKEILKEENNIINIKKQNSLNLKLLEKDQLQKYASNIDAINKNKNIKGPDSAIELAKIEINNLTKQNDEILELAKSQKLQKSIEFAETVGAKIGKNIRTLSNEDVISEFGKEAKDADGFVIGNEIIINKDIAKEATAVTVGSHEILHPILESALKGKDQQRIINEFKNIIGAEQLAVVEERLNRNYNADYIAKNQDEYVTAFSDAILKGEIKYNDNIFTKLGDLIRPILRKFGFSKIKFNTGRDVYNFLKDYNKSVFKGDVSQDIVDIAKGIEEEVKKFSKSKASEKVQEIYEAQGAANAFDIIAEFKPIVDKIVNKYRDVPGFEYQLLKDEIETGKRGILDMIMEYTPEKAKGAPLAAYINKYLSRRAIEAANRILGTEFTLDVTEAKGVTDTTTEEVTETTEEAVIADEIKSLRKEIGLPEELIKTVKKAVIKTFGTKLPNPQDSKFRLELQKRFRTELKKPMAKFVGKQEAYESFLRDNFKAIYNKLPQSLINRRFKDFAEPVLDENGKQMRERTAEGNKIFTKKKITPAEFIKYFLGSDVGRSTQGTRKTAIVEAIAEEIAFDATMEVLRDPNVINKYQEIAGITGEVLPENFKAVIAKQIDRAEGFKFSKSLSNIAKEEYNLEQQELSKILDKNNLNNLSNKYSLLSDNIIYEADPSNIKFSLTTKAEGEWKTNPFAPLADYSKKYDFKVGDIGYEIFVTLSSEAGFDYEIFEMSNDIPDDTVINDPKSIALAFADDRGRMRITGKGTIGLTNQFKVFGTVANSVIDLIKKDNLNSVTFSAKEKSRQRLYQSLNKKFADELGWNTYDFEDAEEGLTFIAYNPKAFSVEPQITSPPPVKFSMSANNKFNVTAKELLRNPKAWAEYSNNVLNASQIYQNYIGSIETSLGSVRPSNVIKYEAVPGFGKLNDKEVIEFKEKIKELQQKIVAQKVTNTKNMLQPGDSYKNPAKVFGRTPNQFLNKIKDGTIFKNTKAYQRIYRDMWGEYFNMLAENSEIYDFLELTLNNSNLDISHWHRLGALFVGFDQGALEVPLLDKNGKPRYGFNSRTKTKFPLTRFVEFEHAVQNHIQWDRVLKAAAKFAKKNDKKGFIEYLEKSMKDYVLIGMAYTDARKVDKAGFAHIMPQGWKRWWDRYFNNKVAKIDGGINPNNISFIEYTDTKANIKSNIGKQFNINDSKGNIKLSKSLNKEFNEQILQATTGVPYYETFSPVKARLMGKGKGKKFFVPYSADDFVGLLYATLGKREVGNQQMEWYQQNLLRPFSRGIQQYEASKQRALRDWMALKKEAAKDVPGGLNKTNDSGFTNQNSVRVYIWNKQGMDIPGMKENDISANLKAVNDNPKLKEFGDRLISLNPEGYPQPSLEWDSGDITTDLVTYINDVKRSEFLTEWKENVDEIFNDQNKNKLRALYGDRFVEALEDIITRMKTGRNRRNVSSRTENAVMNWTNNSVGAIMFFNARSAVLQTLSMVNFINFSDNNPINAGAALANFPQYVKDFATLFNSDFLKQRRTGLQTDVNADEIAKAAATAENKARAILSSLLKFGFTPTQIADSFAIASGGATFYRNRIKTYKKQGLEQAEAEAKAFTDFQEIAEETQQSARPDRISMQQAGSLGRIILAFANTPMQYARLTKKAALDLYNGRGDWKTNLSKIAYYSVIQNIIFSALQQGLFALLFDDEEEDKEKERYFRMANSSLDTLLRGTGVYGAGVATIKNVILEIIDQQKSKRPDYTKVVIEATSFSPPINSKLRKLESAGKVFTYKQSREKIYTEGFSLENPAFLAAGKVISAGTNLPADRIVQKAQHLKTAFEPETELWQSIALAMGWSEWDLGMIEKQTKKEKKPKGGFKIKKFKSGFKTKKFKSN
jgi:hypothetical protein